MYATTRTTTTTTAGSATRAVSHKVRPRFFSARFSVLPHDAVLHAVDDAEDDASRGTSELRARRGGDGAEAVATSTLEGDE